MTIVQKIRKTWLKLGLRNLLVLVAGVLIVVFTRNFDHILFHYCVGAFIGLNIETGIELIRVYLLKTEEENNNETHYGE